MNSLVTIWLQTCSNLRVFTIVRRFQSNFTLKTSSSPLTFCYYFVSVFKKPSTTLSIRYLILCFTIQSKNMKWWAIWLAFHVAEFLMMCFLFLYRPLLKICEVGLFNTCLALLEALMHVSFSQSIFLMSRCIFLTKQTSNYQFYKLFFLNTSV